MTLAQINPVVTLVLITCTGILLRRFHVLSLQDAETLRKIVFNLSLPALIFSSLYNNTIPLNALWIIPGVMIIQSIGYLLFRLAPKASRETIFSGFLGNTGFMGFPLTQSMLGAATLPCSIIYDQAHSFMAASVWLHRNLRHLLNPPLAAIVLAFALKHVPLPAFLLDGCTMIGNTASPLAMLLIGVNFEPEFSWQSFLAAGIKLMAVPAVALLLARILPMSSTVRDAFLLESAMPTMAVSVVYGAEIGLDIQKLSRNVVVCTLLFPLTLLLWHLFF